MFTDRRRRLGSAITLSLGLILAGCSAPPVSTADYPNFGEVKVLFVNGRDNHVITVRALDRLAITEAVLIWPDGTSEPAESIDTQQNPTVAGYGQGDRAFDTVQGQSAEIGGSILMPPSSAGLHSTTTLLGQVASVAMIRLPELAVYRQFWQGAKIVVRLGFDNDTRTETLAAPPPPPP
jgi:hypothetical protein